MQITETTIHEKDQRIGELDRLIERMEEVWELIAALGGNAQVHWGNVTCSAAQLPAQWHRIAAYILVTVFISVNAPGLP